MSYYEIKGKGKDSGRNRRRIYFARDEASARRLAEGDGTVVDEVNEIPPDPPTERQLNYARDLRITVPENATKDDVSALITIKVDGDKPATDRQKRFGEMYGVDSSTYIGKKDLFDRIQADLVIPGREKELLTWFTFRVYRELVGGVDNAPISGPDDPIIEKIAQELVDNKKVLSSVRRYEGRELIWFGEWTSPEGYLYTGGGNRTTAYKTVASLLRHRANIPELSRNRGRKENIQKNRNGCLSLVVFILLLPIAFFSDLFFI